MGYNVHARYLDEGWMYIGMYDNGQQVHKGETIEFSNVEDVIKDCPELDEEFGINELILEKELW